MVSLFMVSVITDNFMVSLFMVSVITYLNPSLSPDITSYSSCAGGYSLQTSYTWDNR